MNPIFEQGKGNSIGHGFNSFSQRFDAICQEHLEARRARAFAFIFYDFKDAALRRMLKDQGVFAKLDRLSGTELSTFYLHTGTRSAVKTFNQQFLSALGVADEAELPCVIFFKFSEDHIEDIEIVQLDSANLIHGFHELYSAIDRYLASSANVRVNSSQVAQWRFKAYWH
jgi:hypothetical protein